MAFFSGTAIMESKPLLFSLLIAFLYLVLRFFTYRIYRSIGRKKNYDRDRINASSKVTVNILTIVFIIVLLSVWGIGLNGIHIYLSSIFAVIGIAFFATWSVLSSITSGIIIYFTSDLKLGDPIRIIDGENSVEGKIIEFGLYAIRIREKNDRNIIIYPNNLAVQKPIVRL